uniref:Uncharacterized protein n=1 Tax=Strongyloides venezuelensis TaxID=75913 RepID=A0A0K0F1B5_STRVS
MFIISCLWLISVRRYVSKCLGRFSDDNIPSIPSNGNQNNETENDPENDYKSDEEFEHPIVSDKRLKIIRTSLRAVNRKEKFVPDNFQMMEEKIN